MVFDVYTSRVRRWLRPNGVMRPTPGSWTFASRAYTTAARHSILFERPKGLGLPCTTRLTSGQKLLCQRSKLKLSECAGFYVQCTCNKNIINSASYPQWNGKWVVLLVGCGSFHFWINMWVAGKTVWSDHSLTCAIPERRRDESLIIKRYANEAYFIFTFTNRTLNFT